MTAANLWRRIWGANPAGKQSARRIAPTGSVAHAAANGEPVEMMLELAAQTLLAASKAQRAGVWLLPDSADAVAHGLVVDSLGVPIPKEWNRLDVGAHFLESLLRNNEPLVFAPGDRSQNPSSPYSSAGPYAGAKRVVWFPLRLHDVPLGLGMIADSRLWFPAKQSALRAVTDELSLALALRRERQRRAASESELDARAHLERSVQRDVPVDTILAEIAQLIERALRAEFVAIGRTSVPIGASAGWAGAPSWRLMLMQEPLRRLWSVAIDEGRIVEASAASLFARRNVSDPASEPAGAAGERTSERRSLARVIALPLMVAGAPLGVLMAGLGPRAHVDQIARRLEGYAALAALALGREASVTQNSVLSAAIHHWLETTPDRLLLVSDTGRITQASRAARGALDLGPSVAAGARLDDLFADGNGRALTGWLDSLTAKPPASRGFARPNQLFPVPRLDRFEDKFSTDNSFHASAFEGALRVGWPARLSVRARLPSGQPAADSWLLALEEAPAKAISAVEENRAASELSGLLDSLDSGVLVFDAEGRIRASNDRFAQIMGLGARTGREPATFENLVDALSSRFAHPAEFGARWRECANRRDEASWDELELLRPERKVVERFMRPVRDAHGRGLGWIEVYRDITRQRLIQSKLLQSEKMAALGQLISGIAHELNNPLTSIQGYAQLLLSRRPGPDRIADAQRIRQEAERAGRIVKNLLLFAREAKPERGFVDMNEIVERALALRSYELKVENIQAELDLDPRLATILADASQMLQIVLNLIVNAEQALEHANGRKFEAESRLAPNHLRDQKRGGRIRIRTQRVSEHKISLEVSDDGPGIPADILARVFDPFFTTKAPGVGTGLGLSIAYGIVREHGGEITVDSTLGHGAKFTVQLTARAAAEAGLGEALPLSPAADVPAVRAPLPSAAVRPQKAVVRTERILVVEDEPTVAQLITDVLAEEGYRIDKLLDSREAIERVRTQPYDLVICDLKMPHVDGRTFYRNLTSANSPLQHRVVFVTGDTLSPHTLEFLESSGLPYLAKPFLVEELKQVVEQAIARVHAGVSVAAGKNSWPQSNPRKQ